MSFLQTVGIASQRGREINRENQQDRMALLQESTARNNLDRAAMFDYIYKLVMGRHLGQAATPIARATGGALAGDQQAAPDAAAAVPPQPQPQPGELGYEFRDGGYKHGGKVKAKTKGYADGGTVGGKFDGIFDAARFNGELPDIYKEHLIASGLNVAAPDWTTKVDETVRRFMDGGMVQEQPQELPRGKTTDPLMEDRARMMVAGAVRKFSNGGSLQPYDPTGQNVGPTMGGGGGVPGGMQPFPGFANGGALGGMIEGPGTGTSDSIPAVINGQEPIRVSDGEFIIPADVVKAKGEEFFNKLIEKYHRRA